MTINPAPVLTIDGVTAPVSCAVTAAGGLLRLSATAPTITGALVIRWGRDDPWSTPEPSLLTTQITDPTGAILARMRDGTLIGRQVEVTIPTNTTPRRLFKGTITELTAQETTLPTATGDRIGWTLNLTCSCYSARFRDRDSTWLTVNRNRWTDFIAQVANFMRISYPDLTMDPAQWTRGGINTNSYIVAPGDNFAPSEHGKLEQVAACTGDYYQYRPDTHSVGLISQRSPNNPSTEMVIADPHNGVTLHGSFGQEYDGTVLPTTWLDGCTLGRTTATDATQSIVGTVRRSRVTYGWGSSGAVSRLETDAPWPRTTVEVTTGWENTTNPGSVADELLRRATVENRGPHHPPVTYRTDTAGGFRSWTQALALLKTWETPQPVAILGSAWTRATASPLVHTILGGELRYSAGHWTIPLTLRRYREPSDYLPAWSLFNTTNIKWGNAGPDRHFIPAVTWADLGGGLGSSHIDPMET